MTICIVVPCYNEYDRLPQKTLLDFIEANPSVDFLLVNDGSTDKTEKLINELTSNHFTLSSLHLEKNSGKAEAVRLGVLQASQKDYDYIAYIDADMASHPDEVLYIINKLERNSHLLFGFGSRIKTLSNQIERRTSRHLTGRVFATFASNSLKLPIYDTQCGCKVFKRELVDCLFKERLISPWMFDVELFWRLIYRYGRAKISEIALEVPLRKWVDPGASKIKWIDIIKFPLEFIRIHRYYKKRFGKNTS